MFDNCIPLDTKLSKEDYLLSRAKEALATDIYAAKSWLITAKSLFPHSSKVQFEAYRIEKLSKNVKEAAKCFSEIFQNFPEDREIWAEIETVTACLRSEKTDPQSELLCQMFQHIPQELQHRLLVMTADHSEDTMEHCKLLLLLLKKFPHTISTHGSRLVETLLTAEKHSHPGQAVNDFRRLLACEALPLLGEASVDLNPRLSLRLLCKAIEFYLAYVQQPPPDSQIQNPWDRLFQVIDIVGKKLSWELSNLFSIPWNQEIYCETIQKYTAKHANALSEESVVRQLLICAIAILIRILNEHSVQINNYDVPYCLVEAFTDPVSSGGSEPKVKKRKREEIVLTRDGDYNGYGLTSAVLLWDILHSTEYMKREVAKLSQQVLRLDAWLNPFLIDLAIYKGLHHDALARFPQEGGHLTTHLRLASTCYCLKDYGGMLDYIIMIVSALPTGVRGKISDNLCVAATRHLHYLPLAELPILQYCCKLLLSGLKSKLSISSNDTGDWATGNALVLMQIDWPQEAHLLNFISERIRFHEAFRYPLFTSYIIGIDILEELTYLWTESGGGISLDIAIGSEVLQGRRITTRGADKGVREEVKQAMRRQAARDDLDPINELIKRFIINEKTAILHSLMMK